MEFGKLKYVHHTIDTYSGFQWATALSSEKADLVITHLLEVMAIMGISTQIKAENGPAYVSKKMKCFFAYYNIKHITGIPNNSTGEAVTERSNHPIMDMLNKQKGIENTLRNRLHNALFTLNFLYVYNILSACMPEGQKREPDLITDGCEPPCGCWELNSGPLEEQAMLLTSEPSLHPNTY